MFNVYSELLPNILSILVLCMLKWNNINSEYCDTNLPVMINTILSYSVIITLKMIAYSVFVYKGYRSSGGFRCLYGFADLIIYT